MGSKNSENTKIEKEVRAVTGETLKLLGFPLKTKIQITGEAIEVEIEGDDLGLLIGQRGEHLESLQIILGLIINKKIQGDWRPVLIDVGGWRKSREESLKALVAKEAARITGSNEQVKLFPMTPSQRRTVHIFVSEYAGLESTSVGEEPERYVVIKRINKNNED
ncbi:KH domain-containing protein [Patescibacteria group bacterium]|nr:KH domain-containing protein [Patescibacteria group bacterium]